CASLRQAMQDADDPHSPGTGLLDQGRPLGVYVHVPFCRARCPYCDFATTVVDPIPHDEYAAAVLAELASRAAWFRGQGALRSIYFGGGTPGLWRAESIGRVIAATRQLFAASGPLEITVETNPGEATAEVAAGLVAAGVNRVSLGAQAFQDHLLAAIGRQHSVAAIEAAVRAVRSAGIDNLCADLMFGLPGQTLNDWRDSLDALVALAPEHITAYALTVERGTPFGARERAGQLHRPDDDQVATLYSTAHEVLQSAGFEHYEISSYARPGRRAVHNTLYWTGGAYLGVGASASSFRPLADGTGWRFSNPRALPTYLRSAAAHQGNPQPVKVERRSADDLENEALWLALRTVDGVDRAAHLRRYGRDPLGPADRVSAAQRCAAAGWLSVTPDRLRLTAQGFLFADEVASRLWRA
ncbi:MAG TPA: radical SAM family heme chaperone HemW, partial [Polyangia bacterium]